jgi:L-malate glycosyltransferase
MARRMARAIHQFMPGFLYGDALGNQAFRIRELLRRWGFESQIYAQFRDQRFADSGQDYTHYSGNTDSVVIFHYSIGSPLTSFVRGLPDTVVPYYHNVTPPEFLQTYNPKFAALLAQGRCELVQFKDVRFALAASPYNSKEMVALGFRHVEVLPYFLYFDELLASAASRAGQEIARRYDDGKVNILFVGRIVPNKRQDDLLRAFNYYQRLVNRQSRLLLVGSDANSPGYRLELEVMVDVLGLDDVHLVGAVGLQDGLGGYYRAASVYLSMSEHEGFGVPLVEAMRFDVPVLAYKSSGVPYALGNAGILFSAKRYDVIAETIAALSEDPALRAQVVATQRQRLTQLTPEITASKLKQFVDVMSA